MEPAATTRSSSTSEDGDFHDVPLTVPDPALSPRSAKARQLTSSSSEKASAPITAKGYAIIVILFLINLLNYMDRLTISSVLTSVQDFYRINDQEAGLLQTVFLVFFLAFAPVCGYLGDRYNRKWIMVVGLCVWVIAVLASTFVPDNMFWLFLLTRGIVGVGEASYSIVAPTVLADLFSSTVRSRVLMIFYFAIPVGSGLGYIVGSAVAGWLDDWRWGVRVTPFFGAVCILILVLFIEEPEREKLPKKDNEPSSFFADLVFLAKNKTYVFSTLGYTFVLFVTGTLSWWAPAAIQHARAADQGLNSTSLLDTKEKDAVGFYFGMITLFAGIIGVCAGTFTATMWKKGRFFCRGRPNNRADALVSGIGSLLAAPLLFAVWHTIRASQLLCWGLMLLTVTALCLNWAINVDLLLYIVPPKRRGAASAVQTSFAHAFGDASGPYVIGLVSDWARGAVETPEAKFNSLQTAFYAPNAVLLLSALMFFVSAFTLNGDLTKLDKTSYVYNKQRDSIRPHKRNAVSDSSHDARTPI